MAIGDQTLAQSDAAGALPLLYAATAPGVGSGDYYGPDGLFEMRGAPSGSASAAGRRRPRAGAPAVGAVRAS